MHYIRFVFDLNYNICNENVLDKLQNIFLKLTKMKNSTFRLHIYLMHCKICIENVLGEVQNIRHKQTKMIISKFRVNISPMHY